MDEPHATHLTTDPGSDSGQIRNLEGHLRERAAEVARLLDQAEEEGRRTGPAPRLLENYRQSFARAMVDLGETLADYLIANDVNPDTLSDLGVVEPLQPLIKISRSLPLIRSAQAAMLGLTHEHEVHRLLLDVRQAAFDLPTMVLNDYYQGTTATQAFRARASLLGQRLREEVRRRADAGQDSVHVLNLRCGEGIELEPVLADRTCGCVLAMTCVDETSQALRLARQALEPRLTKRPLFLRSDPLTLNQSPTKPRGSFDIVYTLSLFDRLPWFLACELVESIYNFLRPGGTMLTGGQTSGVPRGERALVAVLLGGGPNYFDEAQWQQLLTAAPFDRAHIRLEHHAPATMIVSAARPAQASPPH